MMCLTPHSKMIEQCDGPAVSHIAVGSHTMLPTVEEQVVEQPCNRLARVPLPLR
jgi:hypothetical protein